MSEDDVGFGAWYDDRQGETGDLWHRTLIDPGLLACLGELSPGSTLLDVGCGNGYLARRLARRGAKVTGVDASVALVERARARESAEPLGVVYYHADAAAMPMLQSGSFDVALANMSLVDIENAAGALEEIGRVVRSGGRFVASISHPCFDIDTRSSWEVETTVSGTTVYRRVTDYRRPHSDVFAWEGADAPAPKTVGYHRPISWYARSLRRAGFFIVGLDEPAPTAEFVGHRVSRDWINQILLHLVIDARREGPATSLEPAQR